MEVIFQAAEIFEIQPALAGSNSRGMAGITVFPEYGHHQTGVRHLKGIAGNRKGIFPEGRVFASKRQRQDQKNGGF